MTHNIFKTRVFWRPKGSKVTQKNDTRTMWLVISGLKENVPYELVIKAGNRDGTSTLTEPVSFTLSDKYIISSSTHLGNSSVQSSLHALASKVAFKIGLGTMDDCHIQFYHLNVHACRDSMQN